MALEQLHVYLNQRPQSTLGPTVVIGADSFPMLESSELKQEHQRLDELIEYVRPKGNAPAENKFDLNRDFYAGNANQRSRLFLALIERCFAYETRLGSPPQEQWLNNFFGYGVANGYLAQLIKHGVEIETIALPALLWLSSHGNFYYFSELTKTLLEELAKHYTAADITRELKTLVIAIRPQMFGTSWVSDKHEILKYIDALAGSGIWQDIHPGEVWTDKVIADLSEMSADRREDWLSLLRHCKGANSAKPNKKWNDTIKILLKKVGREEFEANVIRWFALVDKARTRPTIGNGWDGVDETQRVDEINGDVLRGLLWTCILTPDREICRAITKIALSAYRKIRGFGPRAVKVGNAAVYVLGEISSKEAVGQLAILKVRVKFATAQKGIEKALVTSAERAGIPRDELEELSVPTYGLTEVGYLREEIGEYVAEVKVEGSKASLAWYNQDGKAIKTVPASLKADHAEEFKDLKNSVSDLEKMLPAQCARIEKTYLEQKDWEFATWRQRYLDHPLVGSLARRLIWHFTDGARSASAIFHENDFLTSENKKVDWLSETSRVHLWHPLHDDLTNISAWRDWLVLHSVQQPFKQAHREIYLLTEAEQNTRTYSNRFAAHILKQHQFNALCAARGWRNQLRLMVDDNYAPPYMEIPAFGLRVEFWVDTMGNDYPTDTNASGAFLYLSTDQVRYHRTESATSWVHASGGGYVTSGPDEDINRPIPLERIPPIVFSETMRDVDLFVGVASIGNDPTWADSEGGSRYQTYWQGFSFGDLGAMPFS